MKTVLAKYFGAKGCCVDIMGMVVEIIRKYVRIKENMRTVGVAD
jgi:hypothetical protein